MGDRYFLQMKCTKCGTEDNEVYFAPTCGFTNWKCPTCGKLVNLIKHTGITAKMASNKVAIKKIIKDIIKFRKSCK
jgi:ribosomal protein S27E